MVQFEDVIHSQGTENIPGTAQMHYYIKKSDLTTVPEPSGSPTTLARKVIIMDDFVPKIGKKFWKMYSTMDTGEVKWVLQGENDSRSILSYFEWKYPGTLAQAEGLVAEMKHTDMVFIAVEGNGDRRCFGNNMAPAILKVAEGASGKKGTDYKGITMRVEWTWDYPAPHLDEGVSVPINPDIGS